MMDVWCEKEEIDETRIRVNADVCLERKNETELCLKGYSQ